MSLDPPVVDPRVVEPRIVDPRVVDPRVVNPPGSEESPPADTWQQIESALDELTHLAGGEISPGELHSRLLERLVGLLSARGGIVWSISAEGQAAIDCQLQLDQSLGGSREELARQQEIAIFVAREGRPRLVPPAFRGAGLSNATPWLVILCPIAVDGRPRAVVQLFQRPDGRAAIEEGYLRLVAAACEIALGYHHRRELESARGRQAELASLADYVQRIHQRLDLPVVAAAIANEARRLLACDRVTVLACRGQRPRVVAVSGARSFDRRSGVVQAIEQVGRLVISAEQVVWLPDSSLAGAADVAAAYQSLADESHTRGAGFLPLFAGQPDGDDQEPIGLLVVEQFAGDFSDAVKRQATLVALASAPALANALEYEHIPLRSLLQWLAAVIGLGPRRSVPAAVYGAAAAAIVAIFLCLAPAEFTIQARGQLWPRERRHVFAPSDAVVVELPVRDGDQVRQGQRLVRLHSPALDIDESELLGKQRTVQEDLLAAETGALRSELDQQPSQPRFQLTARVEQLKAELRGIQAQLDIVRQQQAELNVNSPLAGTVITWDPERQLAARPVKRGDLLLTVADVAGRWELVLDVPDGRAGHVAAARGRETRLPVTFQTGTDPGHVRQGEVSFVAPATEVLAGQSQPAVRVIANLTGGQTENFRPGAGVVARIHCGRRAIGYVWLHELWEAVRLRLFL
jgi:multidrug efflux pump subunit AcrA (membrane-fusion protein)